jgi:hypothetical protein
VLVDRDTADRQLLDLEPGAAAGPDCFQEPPRRRDDLRADAVARQRDQAE